MPLYEYKCGLCGEIRERIQKVGADPINCPECGIPMERLIGAPGLKFNGSGFYVNDYGNGGETEVALPSEDE